MADDLQGGGQSGGSGALQGRLESLDALRGVAAALVVLYHLTHRYHEEYPGEPRPFASVPWGDAGVWLFFMISGFVILLSMDKATRPLDFVVSRASRLYPLFWVCVLTTFAVVSVLGLPGREVGGPDLVLNLTMVPRLLGAETVDGAYWTLGVELLFYAGILVAWWLGLLRARRLPRLLAAMLAVAVAPVLVVGSPVFGLRHAHLFAAGMALCCLRSGRDGPRAAWVAVLAVAPLVDLLATGPADAAATAVFTGLLLVATSPVGAGLAWPPAVWLGHASYGWYLLHQNIGYAIMRRLHLGATLEVVVAMAATLGLAAALVVLVERPALRALRRAYRRRTARIPVPAG